MTYIYDIALNFQDNYYQFFEWNKHDKIKNLSKLPIYHVTDEDILNFKNNKVKVDISTIQKFKEENAKRGTEGIVSGKDSSITVMRIPTDEEYMICCDVEALMNK